jgi:Amt family ammonium transporter
VGALAVLVFSFVVTYVIGYAIQRTWGFRISQQDEVTGIDGVVHAETAYDLTSIGGGAGHGSSSIGQARAEARSTEGVGV